MVSHEAKIKYHIGVDGGGTGTRVLVTDTANKILATAHGDPSALGQGIERAWRSILDTLARAFHNGNLPVPMLTECAIGLGLSGANNIIWKNEFYLRNPGFNKIIVDTDGFTTLLGAHAGKPGVIVAVGTGSVGMAMNSKGERFSVSGWGFPSGDEASGAWLGLRACALTQKALDKRTTPGDLSKKVLEFCGGNDESFLTWLGKAGQNTFARLAPLVFQSAETDIEARNLLLKAGLEIEQMVVTLDGPGLLPLSICGRLGEALIDYLPSEIKARNLSPKGDSTVGAIELVRNYLDGKVHP